MARCPRTTHNEPCQREATHVVRYRFHAAATGGVHPMTARGCYEHCLAIAAEQPEQAQAIVEPLVS